MTVAITGTGVVSPLGIGTAAFMGAIREGKSAIQSLPETLGIPIGARFSAADRENLVSKLEKKHAFLMDPVSQYAVVAAREAFTRANLASLPSHRVGAIIGIGICGIESVDAAFKQLYAGDGRVSPFAIPRIMPSAAASHITMALGIHGPSFCTTSACASSAHAIITGALWLEAGLLDAVIVGGTEAPFAYGLLKGWDAMRVMAKDTCRPFSENRQGMVLGEGAGALVLERLDDALQRNAKILALLQGFAANADGDHMVRPDEDSVAAVIKAALQNACATTTDIGHINSHGTGTEINDRVEAHAIETIFTEHRPWVSGTKGATGHTLGAAGALEAIITIHALAEQWIPPTLNNLGPDPCCANIQVSPPNSVNSNYHSAISNSFAFGGLNAVLVFSRQSNG